MRLITLTYGLICFYLLLVPAPAVYTQILESGAEVPASQFAGFAANTEDAAVDAQGDSILGSDDENSEDPEDANPHTRKRRSPVALGLFMGALFGPSAMDLFDTYNNVLGGPGEGFEASTLLGAATRIPAGQDFRLSLSIESYSMRFAETFTQDVFADGPGTPGMPATALGTRTISEDMNVRVIPVFLALEYMPVKAQFRTYAGLGLGAAFGWATWSEALESTWKDDPRNGGLHFDGTYVAPAGRIYAGTQLGFDEHAKGSSLHSMFIEARYTFISASLPFFEGVTDQFDPVPEKLGGDFGINPGGFSLVVGFTIEFRKAE